MRIHPPRLAKRFLHFFLKGELLEEAMGDLDEKFQSDIKTSTVFHARLNYWKQVFQYLRPMTIKKPYSRNSNSVNMVKHNLLLSYRNFTRYKSSFLINLLGLSTGLACALLIYLWINDELQVDKFNENDAYLYKVLENQSNNGEIVTVEGTPGLLAETLASEFPEVEYAAQSTNPNWFGKLLISFDKTHQKSLATFASKDFLKMFSYNLLDGDRNSALNNRNSALISGRLAKSLFHTTEGLVGKSITWQLLQFSDEAVITGVFKDIPSNATDQFDLILSFERLKEIFGENLHWGNNNAITYVQLKKSSSPVAFNDKIKDIVRDKKMQNVGIFVQKYSDQYLHGKYENGKAVGGRIEYVSLFSIIAILFPQ